MQAITERRLGFVAAIALTTAAFAVPPVAPQLSTYMTQKLTRHASATPDLTISSDQFMKLAGLEKQIQTLKP